MKYTPYTYESLKKAFVGALSPAHLDLSRMMGEDLRSQDGAPIEPYRGSRLALVAALGMGIRKGIFSREEVQALQKVAAKGHGPSIEALRAMQAENPTVRAKQLGVLLWRIKYGGEQGPEVFLAAAHLLASELRKKSKDKRRLGPRYIAVMQCALTEWLHDRCQPCKGTGQIGREKRSSGRNHPALYTCECCHGTGAYEPGNGARALALRIDLETFMDKWERRYEGVLGTLKRIDRLTGAAIDRQANRHYATGTDR
jgi:hypothetical protein